MVPPELAVEVVLSVVLYSIDGDEDGVEPGFDGGWTPGAVVGASGPEAVMLRVVDCGMYGPEAGSAVAGWRGTTAGAMVAGSGVSEGGISRPSASTVLKLCFPLGWPEGAAWPGAEFADW